jgi:hypothetical protein
MFGHGVDPDLGVADFWVGVGVVDVDGVLDVDVEVVVKAAVLCVPEAADALEIPAAVPPVASAPAIIVAPSILEMVIGSTSWGRWVGCVSHGARWR